MIENRWLAPETLPQYKVYLLCCQELLNSYEELAEACEIDALVDEFDRELQNSYCDDQYSLAVETMALGLTRLSNRYSSQPDVHVKLTDMHHRILEVRDEWDCYPVVAGLRDLGRGLAQDFYREGNHASNSELIASRTPALVLSNVCFSEAEPCQATKRKRPISILAGEIHLPFDKTFDFRCYLSYPLLFFHEYASHIYLPQNDSRPFEEGWLVYAIEVFMKTRWPRLCREYALICEQLHVLEIWKPCFTRSARKGYRLAQNVDMWLEQEQFLRLTWDLASYPSSIGGHFSFHSAFLHEIESYAQLDKGHLLRSYVDSSVNALELYRTLRAGF